MWGCNENVSGGAGMTNANGIFLVKPINDAYSFSGNLAKNTIELSKDEIIIPADLLTAESNITISISDNGSATTIDDCVISKVERELSLIHI